jgi:BlaI family transcriptional regulator, penicillinase repressor
MARRKADHPTDAELEILGVLWELGPTGLGGVYDALRARRDLARTTVATMLGVMLDKGLVTRREGPGGYLWTATADHASTARGMMGKVIDTVFGGSAVRMVAHLVEEGRLSPKEAAEVKRLLADAEQRNSRKKP